MRREASPLCTWPGFTWGAFEVRLFEELFGVLGFMWGAFEVRMFEQLFGVLGFTWGAFEVRCLNSWSAVWWERIWCSTGEQSQVGVAYEFPCVVALYASQLLFLLLSVDHDQKRPRHSGHMSFMFMHYIILV